MKLTQELKRQGFCRTRTFGSTTWVLCETEGFWYPIRDGKVNTKERICEYPRGGERWHYIVSECEEDSASTFTRLAKRHSK